MNSNVNDIRDVRPPVDLPGFPWWGWLVILLLCAAVFALYRYWQSRRSRPTAAAPKTSWELAYERLAQLERQNLFGQGKVKEYYIALSDIIRRYIEDRFNIQAPEMTTEEFLNSVKANAFVADKHQGTLKEFLNFSDMVKFAKYGPSAWEARESFDLARRFVDETKIEEEPAPQQA